MAERIRNNPVQLYFSDEELEILNARMKEFGITNRSNFIRKMALNGYMVRIDENEIREMISLLRRCSNNLNQYARMANATGSIYAEDIEEIRKDHEAIWDFTRKILQNLSRIT